MASIGGHLVAAQRSKSGFKEARFFWGLRQSNRGAIAFGRFAVPPKPRQKVGAAGVKRLITVEFTLAFHRCQKT